MKHQKVKEKIALAKASDQERNRAALARLKARMLLSGESRLQRQVEQIVGLLLGEVRP